MQIGAMNHPARNPLEEIDWFGRHGFDFVDFTPEPPAADPDQIDPAAVREEAQRYVVDRLRQHSRVLEPEQKIDPYRYWGARISDFAKALAELTELIFRQLKGVKDTYSTSSHFSVSQLDVVKAVVLAVVSNDFTPGTQAESA
jgi:hypothetical protein